jgi:hypothetical protein
MDDDRERATVLQELVQHVCQVLGVSEIPTATYESSNLYRIHPLKKRNPAVGGRGSAAPGIFGVNGPRLVPLREESRCRLPVKGLPALAEMTIDHASEKEKPRRVRAGFHIRFYTARRTYIG